jgi:NitT/TauT family transport system substrate-binding protein
MMKLWGKRINGGCMSGSDRRLTANIGRAFAIALTVTMSTASAQNLRKITVGAPNGIGLTDTTAHLALTMELGYFKEEGLEIDLVNFRGTAVLLPQVAGKKIDIGWGPPDIVISGKQPDRDNVPIRFFYNWYRSSIWEFAVLEESPIKALEDLKGQTIGVNFLSGGQIPQTKAILKNAGLDVGRDVELIATGYGPPAFLALTTGQVQALALFDGQHVTLENRGTKLRRLKVPAKYEAMFTDGFYAHEDTIKNDGKMLGGFGRAVSKGMVACQANPEACVRALWKLIPSRKPAEGADEKNLADSVRIMKARFLRLFYFDSSITPAFGEFPEQPWRDYLELLKDANQIKTADVTLSNLYTNEFVPTFNNFDSEQVRRQALSLK